MNKENVVHSSRVRGELKFHFSLTISGIIVLSNDFSVHRYIFLFTADECVLYICVELIACQESQVVMH